MKLPPFHLTCACGQLLEAGSWASGKRGKCPTCFEWMTIPCAAGHPFESVEPVPEEAALASIVIVCYACAEEVPEGSFVCPFCGERLSSTRRGAAARRPGGGVPRDRPGLPWDVPSSGSFFSRLFSTIAAILLYPRTAFQDMALGEDFGKSFVFSVLMNFLAALVGGAVLMGLFAGASMGRGAWMAIAFFLIAGTIVQGALRPIFHGLAVHGCLVLFGGAKESMNATWKTTFYATGVTAIAASIPFLGMVVSLTWTIPLMALGLREVHGTSGTRALLAALVGSLPFLFCCSLSCRPFFLP